MRITNPALALFIAACSADDPATPGDTSSSSTTADPTSSSTADTSSSSSEDSSSSQDGSSSEDPSSSGEPPMPSVCELAEIAQGIVGRTNLRTCDTEGDCVEPESGVDVWLFDENPQIGGDASDPGTLNPDVPMLEMTTSAADGRFEFALGASSYHVCTPVGADPDAQMVLCSDAMIIVGANPMHVAIYEHGNGPTQSESWSTSSCLD